MQAGRAASGESDSWGSLNNCFFFPCLKSKSSLNVSGCVFSTSLHLCHMNLKEGSICDD